MIFFKNFYWLILVALSLQTVIIPPTLAAADKSYYTVGASEYVLKSSNLDGSGVVTLWLDDGIWGPNNVVVDTVNGKVYVKDNVSNTLKRCNTDGTGQETFLAANVNDMDVDTLGGKIYYTVGAPDYDLKRSNLDGTDVEVLWADDGTWGPNNVVVDTVNGKVYVKDNVANTLKRCNLDGTDQETFLVADVSDMDVDTVGGKIYYTIGAPDYVLKRSNLDGSGVEVLKSDDGIWGPNKVAVDTISGKVLVKDNVANILYRYNLDGTGQVVFLAADVSDMDVDIAAPEIVTSGNSVSIIDGDTTPSLADHTDFGSTTVLGGTITRTFTVQNTGSADLTIGSVTLSGANAADFSVTSQPVSPVSAAGSTTFQVTFDPSGPGTRTARISFSNSDGAANPFNFSIQGIGLASPTITTSAATSVAATSATLGGIVINDGGATVTERGIVYSVSDTVPEINDPAVTKNTNGSGTGSFSESIGSLLPNTTYYFQAYAINSQNTSYGNNGVQSFTTLSVPPTLATNAASGIGVTVATLNGTVNANNSSTTVSFEYGLTATYGTTVTAAQSPVSGTSDTAVSGGLTGLVPNTTYHYRVVGVNGVGTANGADMTFTTSPSLATVTTNAASGIGTTTATLNGVVNANNSSATVTFQYGLSAAYGTTVTAVQSPVTGTSNAAVSRGLTGLVPNTTYHYRVVGVNAAGSVNGADMAFTTNPSVATVTTNAAGAVSTTSATLNGTVNANNSSTTVTFEYGQSVAYGTSVTADQSPVTGTSDTAVSVELTGLVPNTTYHYRVVGVNDAGSLNGADMTFFTQKKKFPWMIFIPGLITSD